jgi:hypothetical protein
VKNIINTTLFLLSVPLIISAQTIHTEKDKIIYKGNIHVDGATAEQLTSRAKRALSDLDKKNKLQIDEGKNGGTKVWAEGVLALTSIDHVSTKVTYLVEIDVKNEDYEYRIDSVYLVQKEPGQRSTKISSEDLLKQMESSGPVAADTERQLNEIDMDFQKLIDRIINEMAKT